MGVRIRPGGRRGLAGAAATAAGVVAAGLLLSACSGATAKPAGTASSAGAPAALSVAPTAVVQAAAVKAVAQRTVSVQVSVPGSDSPVATGVISLGSPLHASFAVSLAGATGLGAAGSTAVIVDGGTVYVKVPAMAALAAGKPWLSASVQELRSLAASLPGGTGQRLTYAGDLSNVSGADLVTMLASVPGAVRVGSDTTDGVATIHYRASESVADLASRAAAQGHQIPDQLRARLASGSTVTVDTWVDSAGLPRRITVAVSGVAGTGSKAPSSVDMRFGQYGAPVAAPPAADQVGDLATVLNRYGDLLGSVSG